MEVGSALYKEGIRWTESRTKHSVDQLDPIRTDTQFLVLDFILTISMTILQDNYHDIDHPVTPFQLLEYQWRWREGKFDTLGKLGSAHRVVGQHPY